MRGRERLLTALRRGTPERVPFFDQLYHRELFAQVLGSRPAAYSVTEAASLAIELGLDAAVIVYDAYPAFDTRGAGETWESEWRVTYCLEGAGWPTGFGVRYSLSSRAEIDAFAPPDPRAAWRWWAAEEAVHRLHESGLAAIGALRGPFAMLAWHLLGTEKTLVAVLDEPELLRQAIELYCTHAEGLVDCWDRIGADALFMTEDLGSSHGPLVSPSAYEELFYPSLERLVGRARARGMELVLHSDGMVIPFFPSFARAGVSAVHPVERRAGMSLSECKKLWGGTFAFCGNLDTKGVLRSGSPQEVRQEVQAVVKEGSPGGGYVFSSDHSVSEGIPLENALAMIDEACRLR